VDSGGGSSSNRNATGKPTGQRQEGGLSPLGEGRVRGQAPGHVRVPCYVRVSCCPSAGGLSILIACSMPTSVSFGYSFTTLSAARRDGHSLVQPQEHVSNQRAPSRAR
jgi:hypothetical protein